MSLMEIEATVEAAAPMTAARPLPPQPGEPLGRARLERMIRVDHAGEYGAERIYAGQIAVLGRGRHGDVLRHMKAQETVHKETFEELIGSRRVRPTALLPLWHAAGYALGAVTAALGERAAMACTHYAAQAAALEDGDEAELRQTIETFRQEELEHRDIGLANEAELTPGYRLLSRVIKAGCKVAIAASERV